VNSSERKGNARITRVYGGPRAVESDVFYDAETVNVDFKVRLTQVAPFRRWIYAEGVEPPTVIAAMVGDDCDIAICQGEARLTNVPEQYIVGPCPET
jgi:hypothetical protein